MNKKKSKYFSLALLVLFLVTSGFQNLMAYSSSPSQVKSVLLKDKKTASYSAASSGEETTSDNPLFENEEENETEGEIEALFLALPPLFEHCFYLPEICFPQGTSVNTDSV